MDLYIRLYSIWSQSISLSKLIHNGSLNKNISYMQSINGNSFEYVKSVDGALGGLENGSWNGLVGMMQRRVSFHINSKSES